MGDKPDVVGLLQKIKHDGLRFRPLPREQKIEIVGYLKSGGLPAEAIGKILDIPRSTVYYYWRGFCREVADFVKRHADVYVGQLAARADALFSAAKQKGDLALCWKIETDFLDKLMKLGMIDTVPAHIDVTLRDGRDPEIIEAELAHDLHLLEYLKDADGQPRRLPPPRDNGHGTDRDPQRGGGGEVSGDSGKRSDEE